MTRVKLDLKKGFRGRYFRTILASCIIKKLLNKLAYGKLIRSCIKLTGNENFVYYMKIEKKS